MIHYCLIRLEVLGFCFSLQRSSKTRNSFSLMKVAEKEHCLCYVLLLKEDIPVHAHNDAFVVHHDDAPARSIICMQSFVGDTMTS